MIAPKLEQLGLICCLLAILPLNGCSTERKSVADVESSESPPRGQGGVAKETKEWSLEAFQTKYLWDLEHHSNILTKYGFGPLGAAWQERDGSRLQQHLAPDFVGSIGLFGAEVSYEDEALAVLRKGAPASGYRELNRDEFVSLLLEYRQRFTAPPQLRFDVKNISPVDSSDLDGDWHALCALRMWGDCGEQQPGEVSLMFRAGFTRPLKERMNQAGWLQSWAIEQVAISQSSRFLFREVAQTYNVPTDQLADNWKSSEKEPNTGGLVACDYNHDNCPDLLITDVNLRGNTLLKGLPDGGFEDVTKEVGLQALRVFKPPFSAAFVDLDNDGWEDLVFAKGIIWKNLAGKRFHNVTEDSNLNELANSVMRSNAEIAYSLTVADYDLDGKLDLYIIRSGGLPISWLKDTLQNPVRNLLLRNLGDWQFEDVTLSTGTDAAALSAFTALWFHANDDLRPDLYVINEFGDGALFVNQPAGNFRRLDIDGNTDDFGSMGITSGDIDNDGKVDLYLAGMYSKAGSRVIGNIPSGVYPDDVMFKLRRLISGSEFYQNQGELSFQAQGEDYQIHDVGWAWGPTMADFNNDGFLDLFSPAGYMSRDRAKPDG